MLKIYNMNKIIVVLFLFSISFSFAQNSKKDEVITKITASLCECNSKGKIKKDNVKVGLGICLIEAMNSHKTELLKAYKTNKINKELIEKVGEAAGEKMLEICPEVLELIMNDEKFMDEIITDFSKNETTISTEVVEEEEIVNEDLNVSGVLIESKIESYLTIVVKEDSGRINTFILLNNFDNSFLITDKVLVTNDKVKVYYYINELYDFKLNKFMTYKIITNISKL